MFSVTRVNVLTETGPSVFKEFFVFVVVDVLLFVLLNVSIPVGVFAYLSEVIGIKIPG